MNKVIIEKLSEFVKEGSDLVVEDWAFKEWSLKVGAFLETSLGPDEKAHFLDLNVDTAWETHALRLGHLQGLIAKAESEALNRSQSPSISPTSPSPVFTTDSRKVFVVHGRDNEAKESTARFLEKLGLQPIILHEQPSAGRTIIEKFETYSGDVAFAVVLLTPDDVGATADNPSSLRKRARQNVIMELGYFMGRLGRTRVCALHKGGVELPSNYQGILYIEMDQAGAWKAKLAQEFVQAKVSIDLTGLVGV